MGQSSAEESEAGPSRSKPLIEAYRVPLAEGLSEDQVLTIPSIGLEYFHYRRALFLAGVEPPKLPLPLPDYITVPRPPPPLPLPPTRANVASSAAARLEVMLDRKGAQGDLVVRKRVLEVEGWLKSGRKLVRGTSLSFVIKVLKYGWIQDGLWPVDPRTGNPAVPPDSPIATDHTPLPGHRA